MQKYLAKVDQNVYQLPLETKKGLAKNLLILNQSMVPKAGIEPAQAFTH